MENGTHGFGGLAALPNGRTLPLRICRARVADVSGLFLIVTYTRAYLLFALTVD